MLRLRDMIVGRRLVRPVVGVALVKVVVGGLGLMAAVASATPAINPSSPWSQLVSLAAFSLGGGILIYGARSDDRATYLGVAFLLIASAFAHVGLVEVTSSGPHSLRILAESLRAVRIDALLPLFVWLFVCRFPRALATTRSVVVGLLGVWVSATTGALILGLGVARHLQLFLDPEAPWLEAGSLEGTGGPAWAVVYALTCAALPVMVLRARRARPDEKRRVGLFAAVVALGSLPAGLIVVLSALSPSVHDVFRGPTSINWAVPVARMLVAAVPLASAYVVLVERVLAVRVLLRRAIRYSLARSTIALVSALPILWLLGFLYEAREARLADLVTGGRALGLLVIGATLLMTWRLRVVALRMLDRFFFRDQYEAHRILTALAERSRSMALSSATETARSFAAEIDRALHVDRVDVLTLNPLRGVLCSSQGSVSSLGLDAVLTQRLSRSGGPWDVDLERGGDAIDDLPLSDRRWLAEGGFRLLVPLVGSKGTLVGCIGLGLKRSEADWSPDDLELLRAVGDAAGLALENRLLLESGGSGRMSGGVTAASECSACRRVQPAEGEVCVACNAKLAPALLPAVLFGKFRLESRIGSGAMGVVFRATDLDLDRPVAIKTLPRLSPEHALRLRREARTLATISHAHLATIYGAETWQDIPLLVLEYLAGGTLEARIRERPLSEADAIALGIAMADVLDRLHSAGLLHRDIKPSNVAYTDDGVPKLLDFDLARILSETASVPAVDATAPDADPAVPGRSLGSYSGVAGTPLYMSPEALYGRSPDISFDLWGAAVTLYEAVTGAHPFVAASWGASMARISEASCRDVREGAPGCSERFAGFLRDALARDPRRRPSSARDMRRRLLDCAA